MKTTNTIIIGALTTKDLESMEPGTVFAHGTVINSPEGGIYMTESDVGRMLMWAAVRGHGIPDWTVYIHWADRGLDYVINNGDKIINQDNVKALVPCSDEAFKWYRL